MAQRTWGEYRSHKPEAQGMKVINNKRKKEVERKW